MLSRVWSKLLYSQSRLAGWGCRQATSSLVKASAPAVCRLTARRHGRGGALLPPDRPWRAAAALFGVSSEV